MTANDNRAKGNSMLVLADSNPIRHIGRAWVNYTIIATCFLVFLIDPDYIDFGFVPAQLSGFEPVAYDLGDVPAQARLVTYIFLHGDLFHLLGNMLVLWVFGDNIEDSMGHWRYALFFVLCGVSGALAETLFSANQAVPVIGASGAVAGVMGAYLLLHPRARVLVLIAFRFPILVPASLFVGLNIATDFVMALFPGEEEALVAWWAHIGGFGAGLVLVTLLRYRDVDLFQPAHAYPEKAFAPFNRILIDVSPKPVSDGGSVGWSTRTIAALKTIAFFVTIVVIVEALVG
jgi:membrane associated rhomboid family serine protease